jgi:hypothetical protein
MTRDETDVFRQWPVGPPSKTQPRRSGKNFAAPVAGRRAKSVYFLIGLIAYPDWIQHGAKSPNKIEMILLRWSIE